MALKRAAQTPPSRAAARRGRKAPTSRRTCGSSAAKPAPRGGAQRPVLQILVVVANTQARTLRAEVEQGFLRTAFGQELVDPKARINLAQTGRAAGGSRGGPPGPTASGPPARVGPAAGRPPSGTARPGAERESGQHSRTRVRASPRRRHRARGRRPSLQGEFSFLVNAVGRPWNRIARRKGRTTGRAPQRPGRLERGGRPLKTRGREHRRTDRVVPTTAAGLQGSKPLVDGRT